MTQIVHRALTRNRNYFIPSLHVVDRPDLNISRGDPVLDVLGEPIYANVDSMWLGGSWHMMVNVDQQYTLETLPMDMILMQSVVNFMDHAATVREHTVSAGSFFIKSNSCEQYLELPKGSRREGFSHNWMLITLPLGATVCTWQRELVTLRQFESIMDQLVQDLKHGDRTDMLKGILSNNPQLGRNPIADHDYHAYWAQQDKIARRDRAAKVDISRSTRV